MAERAKRKKQSGRKAPTSGTGTDKPVASKRSGLYPLPPEYIDTKYRKIEVGDRVFVGPEKPDNLDEVIYLMGYEHRGDPIEAMLAFIYACNNGYIPPRAVLDWLAGGFHAYCEGDGQRSLDECLGLTVAGSGKTAPFEKRLLLQRNDMAMLDMYRLVYYGAKRDDAAELVAEYLQTEDWNTTSWPLANITGSTLAEMFRKRWKRRLEGLGYPVSLKNDTAQRKRKFMERYVDSITKRIVIKQIGLT